MDVSTLTICGISVPLFIQVAVGLAKKLGFPTKYAPHLSAGIGMVCGIGIAVIGSYAWYYGAMAGVFLGAAACGVYDASSGKAIEDTTTNITS